MIGPEIREKIIQMRLDGVTWKEIIEKLNLPQNANHSIYKSPWFIKELRNPGRKGSKESFDLLLLLIGYVVSVSLVLYVLSLLFYFLL